MLPTIQDLGFAQLTNDEKLQLVSAIISSLSPEQEFVIPEHHREEVYRRLEIADANPGVGKSWAEVEAEIQGIRITAIPRGAQELAAVKSIKPPI